MRYKLKIIPLIICAILLVVGCASPALEHLEQGDAYCEQEQWDDAIAEYSQAIELDPEYAEAYGNRGWVYDKKGQYDLAIADLNKVIELSTDPSLIELAEEALRALEGE